MLFRNSRKRKHRITKPVLLQQVMRSQAQRKMVQAALRLEMVTPPKSRRRDLEMEKRRIKSLSLSWPPSQITRKATE